MLINIRVLECVWRAQGNCVVDQRCVRLPKGEASERNYQEYLSYPSLLSCGGQQRPASLIGMRIKVYWF